MTGHQTPWLSPARQDLLRAVVAQRAPDLIDETERCLQMRFFDAGIAGRLRDAVGEELFEAGISSTDGDLNARGLELDELIDQVGEFGDFWKL